MSPVSALTKVIISCLSEAPGFSRVAAHSCATWGFTTRPVCEANTCLCNMPHTWLWLLLFSIGGISRQVGEGGLDFLGLQPALRSQCELMLGVQTSDIGCESCVVTLGGRRCVSLKLHAARFAGPNEAPMGMGNVTCFTVSLSLFKFIFKNLNIVVIQYCRGHISFRHTIW